MTKSELKKLIKECISEMVSDGQLTISVSGTMLPETNQRPQQTTTRKLIEDFHKSQNVNKQVMQKSVQNNVESVAEVVAKTLSKDMNMPVNSMKDIFFEAAMNMQAMSRKDPMLGVRDFDGSDNARAMAAMQAPQTNIDLGIFGDAADRWSQIFEKSMQKNEK